MICVNDIFRFEGSSLNDGQWHSVEIISRGGRLTIAADRGEGGSAHASLTFPVSAGSPLFFGGETETRRCLVYRVRVVMSSEGLLRSLFFFFFSHGASGCPAEDDGQGCRNPFHVFQGCMRLFSVEQREVDLIKVQQKLTGNYSNVHIDMCGIIDRSERLPVHRVFVLISVTISSWSLTNRV